MPLAVLPPDPVPSAEEVQSHLGRYATIPADYRERFAHMSWREELQSRNDSAFHVAFVTEVDNFASYVGYA